VICLENATFKEEMTKLCNAFNREVKADTMAIYWDYLHDLDDEEFKMKCRRIIINERWFPSLSVFFEKSKQDKNEEQFAGAI